MIILPKDAKMDKTCPDCGVGGLDYGTVGGQGRYLAYKSGLKHICRSKMLPVRNPPGIALRGKVWVSDGGCVERIN